MLQIAQIFIRLSVNSASECAEIIGTFYCSSNSCRASISSILCAWKHTVSLTIHFMLSIFNRVYHLFIRFYIDKLHIQVTLPVQSRPH